MKMDFNYLNINDLADEEIALHMRESNFEKYKSLVRMHLSFELELNDFDLPCHEIVYEDKGKWKKWNRITKKQRHHLSAVCSTTIKSSNSSGGSPTEGLHQQIDAGFLFHLKEIKEFLLLEKNITQEGIFRKTGSVSRQNELRIQIQSNKALELESSSYSAHDCATVFKGYLAELPEPVLTDAHYPAHLQLAPLCIGASYKATRPLSAEREKREEHLLNSVQLLLLLLPYDNRQLLMHIIDLLYAAARCEHLNKMCAENLATLFAPHLICPRNMPPEALHYLSKKMSSIIAYMVTKGNKIFEMPAKLSTDIRAYFLERKRKKTMSPELTLDESISDISAVETVYTFVDREKTAAAHTTNTTDTELAQLYAHIQSLPESSKKRRLIKQFNRQNGQGTPLQLVVMNRIKNSDAGRSAKSLGESIKKHIFHKAMYRTPKRTNPTSTILEESIMTPRSRKPVMVLTNLGNSDQNQTICQTDLSSFREQDEDDSADCDDMETHHLNLHNEDAVSAGCYSDILRRKQLMLENQSFIQQSTLNVADKAPSGNNDLTNERNTSTSNADALSNNFKEYLLSRSVLTASPVDSSFFSQPDDFGSTQEIEDLNESQLSSSLLYCLDGNEPDRDSNSADLKIDNADIMETDIDSMSEVCSERIGSISTNPFVILNNARKRTANKIATFTTTKTQPITTTTNLTNKENIDNTQSYVVTKKILISDYPGETSF